MRGTAGALILLAALVGCGSSEKESDSPAPAKPRSAPPAASPAPAASPDNGAIVIKGSKRSDPAPDAPASSSDAEAARLREMKIAELSRKAGEGSVTANWKDFTSPDGSFRIIFPRVPDQKEGTQRLADGTVLRLFSFAVVESKPDDRGFTVSYTDLPRAIPPEQQEAFMGGAVIGVTKVHNAHTLETKSLTSDGNPALETRFEFADGKGFGCARVVLNGTRLYVVSVAAPKADQDARDVERYMDSFKILKAPPGVGGAAPAPAPAGPWVDFTSPDGSFRAQFPVTPTASDVPAPPAADGSKVTVTRFTAKTASLIAFVTTFDSRNEPTSADLDSMYANAAQTPGSGFKGRQTSIGDPAVGDITGGRDIRFELDNNNPTVERDVLLVVGKRVYQLIAVAAKSPQAEKDFKRFVDSFRIMKK